MSASLWFPPRTVLAVVDSSSGTAQHVGLALGAQSEAAVYVLEIDREHTDRWGMLSFPRLEDRLRALDARTRAWMRMEAPGSAFVRCIVTPSLDVPHTLLDYARYTRADWVVVGARSMRDLPGSTPSQGAQLLARRLRKPVCLCGHRSLPMGPTRIRVLLNAYHGLGTMLRMVQQLFPGSAVEVVGVLAKRHRRTRMRGRLEGGTDVWDVEHRLRSICERVLGGRAPYAVRLCRTEGIAYLPDSVAITFVASSRDAETAALALHGLARGGGTPVVLFPSATPPAAPAHTGLAAAVPFSNGTS